MSTETIGVRRVVSVTIDVAFDAQQFRSARKMPDGQVIRDGVADYVRALVSEGDLSVLTPVLSGVAVTGVREAGRDSPLREDLSGSDDVDTTPEETT